MLHPLRRTRTSNRRSMDVTRAVGHGTYEHDCDVGQVTWLSPSSWDFDTTCTIASTYCHEHSASTSM